MLPIVLFDNAYRQNFYPLSYTKALASLYFGALSMQERWQIFCNRYVYVHTVPYLQPLYPLLPGTECIWVDATVLPNPELVNQIVSLQKGEALFDAIGLVACNGMSTSDFFYKTVIGNTSRLMYTWQMFQHNALQIEADVHLLVAVHKNFQTLSGSNSVIAPHKIFIEAGAHIENAILNATEGSIYIKKEALVMDGAMIRGPFVLGEKAVVKMGAKIYGATSIGNYCSVGGEIKNVVMHRYSNKAHDGYLGDSVVGEWCNLGAGTSCSNLNNTAGDVSLWQESAQSFCNVGKKCGVIMGDYTRTAINTAINTGTTIGVCCNIFGAGLSPKNIPNFSWGMNTIEVYGLENSLRDIQNWKALKGQALGTEEEQMLRFLFAL